MPTGWLVPGARTRGLHGSRVLVPSSLAMAKELQAKVEDAPGDFE